VALGLWRPYIHNIRELNSCSLAGIEELLEELVTAGGSARGAATMAEGIAGVVLTLERMWFPSV